MFAEKLGNAAATPIEVCLQALRLLQLLVEAFSFRFQRALQNGKNRINKREEDEIRKELTFSCWLLGGRISRLASVWARRSDSDSNRLVM